MVRNIIGSVLAVIGAAAAVASPFQAWYDGRHGRDYRVEDLFNGITGTSSGLWVSLLLPFAFAALVTLLGLVLRSRPLVALAGLIVLGFTVLWTVRQGQHAGGLTLNGDGTGVGLGVALAFGGGALLLLAAGVMSGRARRRGGHRYVGGGRNREREQERYGRAEPYGTSEPVAGPEQYDDQDYRGYQGGERYGGTSERYEDANDRYDDRDQPYEGRDDRYEPPGSYGSPHDQSAPGSTEQRVWESDARSWDTTEQPRTPPGPDDTGRRRDES
ncbi:hypothetical protein OG875_17860 [Streptomyces sp. NBC_01498]|uniref:hypothetical protein n=1 Tax=Streptomyces sp. NBC_01498 TaxID=2975870 RepID=UPI002E7C48B9|nr:hypothetical protein [Streptomyces sp. NBC_01498]WTL26286.1 hypothetical protein OG875_17860 [Streptomyces sp. NBC_01498]